MGQAVAELPDPLESANPTEAQSADELLSQLAGDEIDRLLAESNGESAPAAKSAEPSQIKKPAEIQLTENQPAEQQLTETPPAAQPAAAKAHAAVPPVAPAVDLDAVLETAVADHQASAERAALNETPISGSPAARPPLSRPADHSPQIELGDSTRRLPLFLRPLEWLSSPLETWPDQVRELLGKIGLLTLINAVAVIAYVLLVRRHHH